MTAVASPRPTPESVGIAGTLSGKRQFRNRLASSLMLVALVIAAFPLVALIVMLTQKGLGVVTSLDWWTKDIPADISSVALADKADVFGIDPSTAESAKIVFGMWPAIWGTLLTTGMAALMSIPLGILSAIYLNEYGGKGRLAKVIRFFTDVMTGVPSVVMGVFIYTVWVIPLQAQGRSAFAGALALGALMLPIVVRSSEEMLRLVPDALRQGSAALGAPRWLTTLKVVLPAALPGITSGAMLAVARGAGETAPVLFAIGTVSAVNFSPWGPNTTLSAQIYSNATQGVEAGYQLAWGAALTLILIVVVLTLTARLVSSKFSVRVDQ
jgi:phosphate transport system permease protein